MHINKQRNIYVTKEYSRIVSDFVSLFPHDSYVGDDMLINNCNAYFLKDHDFLVRFEQVAKAPIYQQMAWRLHILDFFLSIALNTNGSYVECGVFRGFKSFFLLGKHHYQMMDRRSYLFDTFDGIEIF